MDLGSKESLAKIRILSDPDGCEAHHFLIVLSSLTVGKTQLRQALSEEATGLHCSLIGGVVGVSPTPCEKGAPCAGHVAVCNPDVAQWEKSNLQNLEMTVA